MSLEVVYKATTQSRRELNTLLKMKEVVYIELAKADITRARQWHINMNHKLLILRIIVRVIQSLGLGLDTKNSDSLNTDTRLVLERTLHVKLVVRVFEIDLRHRILHDGFTIIEIQ